MKIPLIYQKNQHEKCENKDNAVHINGFGYCDNMPLVCMENLRKMDRFDYVKNTFERYKLSLIFQVFKNWQMCKQRRLIIKQNFNNV